ncbi:hypothetical protein [Lysobacter sp. Root667]|uniref:hypothetical protein n=1 Tax=Lysobacter sp. Root667 TaxID=1736581 RepID=UPI0012DF49DD|nr:hypothetical protein [Lysobacter sp. Root667]
MLLGSDAEGLTTQAMKQGGIGLLLTVLIVTVPPAAAMFFQGTVGSFASFSAFGGAGGQAGGTGGAAPDMPQRERDGPAERGATTNQAIGPRAHSPAEASIANGEVIRKGRSER